MSFTTDNNNENAIKDTEAQKSPGRILAEERAERIRYAQEYRRKLEAEQSALMPKKTKAAEQKEKEKLEKADKEKAERLLKVEEENKEAELRINEAADKVKALGEGAEAAPAEVEANAVIDEVKVDPISVSIPVRVATPAPKAQPATPSGMATLNVTNSFRSAPRAKPLATYGRVVTEGGWEHEIDDIIRPVAQAAPVMVQSDAPVATPVAPIAIATAAVPVSVAAKDPDDELMQDIINGAKEESENSAASDTPVEEPAQIRSVPAKPEADAPAEEPAAQKKASNELYIDDENAEEQPAEAEYERYVPVGASGAYPYNDSGLMNPEGLDGVNFDENFNRFQVENAHLHYLSETKRLDKIRKASGSRRYGSDAEDDFTNKDNVKSFAKRSAEVVALRMEYDARVSANDLQMELSQFSSGDKFEKKGNKLAASRILKIKKSIKKAKKLEKKAVKRYCNVLAKEAINPTHLKKPKKQEKLVVILAALKNLIKERELIDEKLSALYKDSEARAGGKIRIRAEKKRQKRARQIHRGLSRLYRRVNTYDIPDSLREKILHLLNTKVVSESTIAYNKYLLKKLKPKGDAKRALKANIKRARASMINVEKNLSRLVYKAQKYAKIQRRRKFLIVLLILVIIGAIGAAGFLLFGNQIMAMLGLA